MPRRRFNMQSPSEGLTEDTNLILTLKAAAPDTSMFTLYIKEGDEQALRLRHKIGGASLATIVEIADLVTGKMIRGQGMACGSYNGAYVSLTVRRTIGLTSPLLIQPARKMRRSGFTASTQASPEFPVPPSVVCKLIADLIFHPISEPTRGLVVIAGSTGSGKSNIARGLVDEHLRACIAEDRHRRPHLITIEDPIEKWFAENPRKAAALGVDYTPRAVGVDTPNLASALADALRESPTLVFVGECRDLQSLEHLLQLSTAGYLIITTVHASSLVEAVGKILAAADADSPAKRASVANHLLSIIHLRSCSNAANSIIIPTLWRRTQWSVTSIAADGLSSVLPNNPSALEASKTGTFGRQWMLGRLLSEKGVAPVNIDVLASFRELAATLDLEGD
jgi:hypothetical protein